MSRNLAQIQNIVELDEIFPFFAIELYFDVATLNFGSDTISSGPLYFWTGLGDITIGAITYTGAGQFLQISEVTDTADLRAAGATITMSGLPVDIIALALQQPYQGRLCKIKFGMMNANRNKTVSEDGSGDAVLLADTGDIDNSEGDPAVLVDLFIGYMDQMNIAENADSATVVLSVENKLIDLETRKSERYTSEFQKKKYRALYPNATDTDKAFDYLNDLVNKPLDWGSK
jgi:hypothetical protein